MPLAAPPQVRIAGTWYVTETVTPPAGLVDRPLDTEALEYRYWTLSIILAGVAETITARILVAGPEKATPPVGAVVIANAGTYAVELKAVDAPETVIVPAGQLVCR